MFVDPGSRFATLADALIVPYKGTPAVLDLAFEILGSMLPQVQAKVIRALAVTSDKRYPGLPNVPPVPRSSRSNTSGGPICPPLSISSRPSRAG